MLEKKRLELDLTVLALFESNGTARFEKCKQLFEYQHLLLWHLYNLMGENQP
jgi:hypothetical protein